MVYVLYTYTHSNQQFPLGIHLPRCRVFYFSYCRFVMSNDLVQSGFRIFLRPLFLKPNCRLCGSICTTPELFGIGILYQKSQLLGSNYSFLHDRRSMKSANIVRPSPGPIPQRTHHCEHCDVLRVRGEMRRTISTLYNVYKGAKCWSTIHINFLFLRI